MLDVRKARITAVLTLLTALLGLFASIAGVFVPSVYHEALLAGSLSKFLVYGSIVQDYISIPAAGVLLVLSLLVLKKPQGKTFITSLGLSAYFFYGYGLYVMQGDYTSVYLAYLAIFGLSIYSLIIGLTSFDLTLVAQYRLPQGLSRAIAGFFILILVVLVPVWLLRMTPDIARHIPGETYAVFILDLGVVFPALGIIATTLIQGRPFGNILAGVALVKCMTLCLSVALGEILKPAYGYSLDSGMIGIFSGLTVIGLVLGSLYLLRLKPVSQTINPNDVLLPS